jgi:1-acyl-sn-glycerol-3-phosphate acyltransferase
MEDLFYKTIVTVGRGPFWVSSRPLVLHSDRVPSQGPFILASSHLSPYDVPALMRSTPRVLDFVSTVEIFAMPFVGWFFGHMGAFPLNRRSADPKTAKRIVDRLARGRVVALFPEGRIRKETESVIHGATFRPGVARLARIADVPIIPAVVLGTGAYSSFINWLPLRRTRYGVIYGNPIRVADESAGERLLTQVYGELYHEIHQAMGPTSAAAPTAAASAGPNG